jgi:hypothetical protein
MSYFGIGLLSYIASAPGKLAESEDGGILSRRSGFEVDAGGSRDRGGQRSLAIAQKSG